MATMLVGATCSCVVPAPVAAEHRRDDHAGPVVLGVDEAPAADVDAGVVGAAGVGVREDDDVAGLQVARLDAAPGPGLGVRGPTGVDAEAAHHVADQPAAVEAGAGVGPTPG